MNNSSFQMGSKELSWDRKGHWGDNNFINRQNLDGAFLSEDTN